jgi:hypothetical protein
MRSGDAANPNGRARVDRRGYVVSGWSGKVGRERSKSKGFEVRYPYTCSALSDSTIGAYAHFSTFFADIVQPAARGGLHFAGESTGFHHPWVAGALESALRVVNEILHCWVFHLWFPMFQVEESLVFSDEEDAEELFIWGLFSKGP